MSELLSKVELRFLYSLLGEIEDEIKRRRKSKEQEVLGIRSSLPERSNTHSEQVIKNG